MKTGLWVVVWGAGVVLAGAACATTGATAGKEAPVAAGPRAADYYPMLVGTRWTYAISMLGQTSEQQLSLVRAENGQVEDSTGAQFIVDGYGLRDQKRYLLRDPLEVGTKWNNVVSPSAVEHFEIVGVRQPCDAKVGPQDGCVIVEMKTRIDQDKQLLIETTYGPGTGIVRQTTTLENKGARIPQTRLELVGFALGDAGDGGVRAGPP